MKNNTIIELEGSDIISESMHKINDNFRILAEQDEQDRYKWDSYIKSIKEEIEGLKQVVDLRNIDVSRIINGLSDKVNRMPTQSDIQAMVDNALRNTEGILSNTIQKLSNVYVDEYLDGYTSEVNDKFEDLDSRINQTMIYQQSGDKFGSVTIAAANNKFYTVYEKNENQEYLVYNTGELGDYNNSTSRENTVSSDPEVEAHSLFKSLEDFLYSGLTSKEQDDILETFENITDQEELKEYFPCGEDEEPFIHWPEDDQYYEKNCLKLMAYDKAYKVFMTVCKKVFKTIATEVATIVVSVGDGYSETEIINKAFGEHGEEIKASITSWANQYGSGIHLNADQIILDANHKLRLNSENCEISATDNITIDSPNFKVNTDGEGGVEVRGKITATSLTIEGTGGNKSLKDFIKGVGHDEGWDENGGGGDSDQEPYDDKWLTDAFSKIEGENGLLLAGNIFVGSSKGNTTAGMMGADNSADNLRFFAGCDNFNDRENAKFRVYKSGKLIATDAEISGTITANSFRAENTDSVSNIKRTTTINSTDFSIESSEHNSKIYIKIIDKFEITDTNSELYEKAEEEDGKKYLKNVPALCFDYKSPGGNEIETYYLTPATWVTGTINTTSSNLFFSNRNTGYYKQYGINTGAPVINGTYNSKAFQVFMSSQISSSSSSARYKFGFDYGTTDITSINKMKPILINEGLADSSGNVKTLYGFDPNSRYIQNSSSKINITEFNASVFKALLYSGTVYYMTSTISDANVNSLTLNDNIYKLIYNIVTDSSVSWYPGNKQGVQTNSFSSTNYSNANCIESIYVISPETYSSGTLSSSSAERYVIDDVHITISQLQEDIWIGGSKYGKLSQISAHVKFATHSSDITSSVTDFIRNSNVKMFSGNGVFEGNPGSVSLLGDIVADLEIILRFSDASTLTYTIGSV